MDSKQEGGKRPLSLAMAAKKRPADASSGSSGREGVPASRAATTASSNGKINGGSLASITSVQVKYKQFGAL